MKPVALPLPDADALRHSELLVADIRNKIINSGSMPFAEFMRLALYAPGLGYYSAGSAKFQQAGDFTTAPELSPQFAVCVAQQCLPILKQWPDAGILEFGAGSGVLALEVLKTLAALQCLPNNYYIMEVSADLKQRQQTLLAEALPDYFERIVWLDHLPRKFFRGVVIANEVLDAMPVVRFRLQHRQFQEYFVTWREQGFAWQLRAPQTIDLARELAPLLHSLDPNVAYDSEFAWQIAPWIKTVSDTLEAGLVLLFDYGFPAREFYHADRSMGTLMCHYRHHAHADPFFYPGLQDITTHVDFSLVARAAVAADLQPLGYCHQAAFLMSLGILNSTNTDGIAQQYQQAQALKRLLLPTEMGELFKVMALGRGDLPPLAGFQLQNHLDRV